MLVAILILTQLFDCNLLTQLFDCSENTPSLLILLHAGLKTFTLQKIGKAWGDHKCRLKTAHYIPHPRNKAWVKSNGPKGCIPEDWDILVDHWYTKDVVVCSF